MGSFDNDAWYSCDWCGWFGYFGPDVPDKYVLYDVDGCPGYVLCLRCIDLEEPPWRPNNRDRWHEWLMKVFRTTALNTNTHRKIAEYLAANTA